MATTVTESTMGCAPSSAATVVDHERFMLEFRAIEEPIERYLFLRRLKAKVPHAFFALLMKNTHEVLPFVYTPTVGEACSRYHELPLQTWGLYINYDSDKGRILEKLKAWPEQDIQVAVVTDGERILGLGDLGTGGMGISEGKIMLYTVAAGMNPFKCLPICLDVGTNRKELWDAATYTGIKRPRVTGKEYDDFVAEFIAALKAWRPHMLLQFEDFGNHNAFRLLESNRNQMCCFNDDIQGTACVTLAAILSALRVTGGQLKDQRVVFMGAGEAGVGIGELISMAVARAAGTTVEEARKCCFFVDSKGLVVRSRLAGLQEHKKAFAHDVTSQPDLLSTIKSVRPTVLIGVSTVSGAFTEEVLTAMTQYSSRPIVFPLSNPTDKSECTFEQAMEWTKGKVLFASGSPFKPYTYDGIEYHPAQANNAYIFPAIGHAAVLASAKSIPEEVFLIAADALSDITSLDELKVGKLFPSFNDIVNVSKKIMLQTCDFFESQGLGKRSSDVPWQDIIEQSLWRPNLQSRL